MYAAFTKMDVSQITGIYSCYKFSGALFSTISGAAIAIALLVVLLSAMLTVVGLVKLEKGPLVKSY